MNSQAARHFRASVLATATELIDHASLSAGSRETLLNDFEFLHSYIPIDQAPVAQDTHLPLVSLRRAYGLDQQAITLLLVTGLIEEDVRFGQLFAAFNTSGAQRPTLGLLTAWWRDDEDCDSVRQSLRQLLDLGLLQAANQDAPRLEWTVQPPSYLWDCLRGEMPSKPSPWASFLPPESLPELDSLVLPETLRARFQCLVQKGSSPTIVVKGPRHNGRHTLLRALARRLGMGTLEVSLRQNITDDRLRLIGPLSVALNALPIVALEESAAPLPVCAGALAVVTDQHMELRAEILDGAVAISAELPSLPDRYLLWRAALPGAEPSVSDALARSARMTSGNIFRAARSLTNKSGPAQLSEATRSLHRPALASLAHWLEPLGSWERLAAKPELMSDLRRLETRCRHRETLRHSVGRALGDQLNPGVRALFTGPSGTGKTLCARLLAGTLGKDIYRVDLSAVVSKFIGETEKNLHQVLCTAEEHDVVLLLDEGDSLMANRTAVQTSVDRYANLETNFLLQRIESYEGILIVTTNAPQTIDSAFQRRMDASIEFRMPDAGERFAIFQLHLPTEHRVDFSLLEGAAIRCQLTGGQIRNCVLHAALLALEQSSPLRFEHLEEAVKREYRRAGSVCPMRKTTDIGKIA